MIRLPIRVAGQLDESLHSLAERLAHPPLGARANVERGFDVQITENHVNRAAPSGWMERLVRVSLFVIQSGATAGISSQAPVEAQAAKHTREDSAKTPQNPSKQPKPKTLRRLGRTQARKLRRRLYKESDCRKVFAMVFISFTNV